jgi:hypothetical protein
MAADELSNLPWQRVTSSNLHSIALHEDGLFVRFAGGPVYRYEGIPDNRYADAVTLYELLLEADRDEKSSVGKTFNTVIRKGGAPVARVKIDE